MSRKRQAEKRYVIPDPRYKSQLLSKFINRIMYGGKKATAQAVVYAALDKLAKETGEDARTSFEKALKNVVPLMEVRSRRVGGSTYQVPVEVRAERGISLAMRWIVANARSKSGKSMADRLGSELIDAYNQAGSSVKKREDTHKMAEANKAFAHFRW